MHFSSGIIGGLLTGAGNCQIKLDEKIVSIAVGKKRASKLKYLSISSITLTPGIVWSNVQVHTFNQTFNLDGISNQQASRLKSAVEGRITNELIQILKDNRRSIRILIDAIGEFLDSPKYLANRDITQWIKGQESRRGESIKAVLYVLRHPYSKGLPLAKGILDGASKLQSILSGNWAALKLRNDSYVAKETLIHKSFFDSIEEMPLTDEQRTASIVMEDRNLLVAAAGSGKTSTVVGKIGYSLLTEQTKPHEILVLAFNNQAVQELEARIKHRLAHLLGDQEIKVKTFHALASDIIAEVTGKKPSVANFAGGGPLAEVKLMTELIDGLLKSDLDFSMKWVLFLSLCRKPSQNPAQFSSAESWKGYVSETGDYQEGKYGYLTLNGELVKSQGELAIANWLFMKGINYEYERPYKYETADRRYRQYKPDFYFPGIDCYLEHYALDASGNPPAAFGEKYRESMAWKRHLHTEKNTDIFETTFDDFISGVLFEKLESELTKRGATFTPLSIEEIFSKLNQPSINSEIATLLRTFIKHTKSNELTSSELASKGNATTHSFRSNLFAAISGKVMDAYEEILSSRKEVDFEDLIINAAMHGASTEFMHPYKLVLVDEFQDISQARAKLLLALLNKVPECKLFAVGDDWQSIYRFAGSDISIFTGFERIFGHTAINCLTKTFRSNQGIANVAAEFVQKNPAQMRKSVKAHDKTVDRVVVIRQYERLEEMEGLINEALHEIAQSSYQDDHRLKVFILGRYRHLVPSSMDEWHSRYSAQLDIEYRTIHSSKGLQADYVIVIGLHTRRNAFPSEIEDDPLLHMVMPSPETFAHAEERRLFYVAMTRAKHKIFLLGGKFTPSCFLEELLTSKSAAIAHDRKSQSEVVEKKLCPKCNVGDLKEITGKNGRFIGCTNYPTCRFTRNVAN